MWAWVTVRCHAYSTTNSLEPTKALGLMWVSCWLPFRNLEESETKREIKHVSWLLFVSLFFVIVSACDSQSVHVCAVEGVTCHLLDAISGEPSVIRKRSQVTVMWLQHRRFPTVNLFELSKLILVSVFLLFSFFKAAWIYRILVKNRK